MAIQAVPPGFHTVTPYLMVKDVSTLIEFLKTAFGAEMKHLSKAPDGLVMHAMVKIGDSLLMLCDAREGWPAKPTHLYLYVPNVDEVYAQALRSGAVSINAPRNEFYGDRMAGVTDPSANCWWIATHVEDVSEEEMRRRQEKLCAQNAKA